MIFRLEHSAPISRLVYAPDGSLLITVSSDLFADPTKENNHKLGSRTGERKQQLEVTARVADLDVRRPDNICVIVAADRVLIWNPVSGSSLRSMMRQARDSRRADFPLMAVGL